jgi:cell division transport system permease protein
MRALSYALDEALQSLWRGRQSGVLSTLTIAVALFVLGAFLLVTSNLDALAEEWSRSAEMSVYLQDSIAADQWAAIELALAPGGLVAGVEFVSKERAAERFRETFADLAGTLDTLDANPLPASFEVQLQPAAAAGPAVEELAMTLRGLSGVADVRFDREWLDRLLAAVSVIRGVGLGLGAVLTIAAALTVANVVRLALFARRHELEVMQLVGAPAVYIRGPFVMEGVLQGGIGALVSLAGLAAAFLLARGPYLVPLAETINLSTVRFLPVELCVLLVLGGMMVGCLGGIVAASGRT